MVNVASTPKSSGSQTGQTAVDTPKPQKPSYCEKIREIRGRPPIDRMKKN